VIAVGKTVVVCSGTARLCQSERLRRGTLGGSRTCRPDRACDIIEAVSWKC
jgi:hypothetical protein